MRARRAVCPEARQQVRPLPAEPVCATLRLAATPAARYPFQPLSTEFTACGQRTSASSTPASPTWRPLSPCRAGAPRPREDLAKTVQYFPRVTARSHKRNAALVGKLL